MDNSYFPSMAQQRRRFEEREKIKLVNGRDILTTNTTLYTPPSGIPLIDYEMNYIDYNFLPIPDS